MSLVFPDGTPLTKEQEMVARMYEREIASLREKLAESEAMISLQVGHIEAANSREAGLRGQLDGKQMVIAQLEKEIAALRSCANAARVQAFEEAADFVGSHEDYEPEGIAILLREKIAALRSKLSQAEARLQATEGYTEHLMAMLLRLGLVEEVWLETWHPELYEIFKARRTSP